MWSQGAKRDVDGFALTLGGGEGVDVKAGAKKLQAGAQQLLGQVESQAGAGAGGDGSAGGSDWQVFHISYQSNVTFTVSSQKMTLVFCDAVCSTVLCWHTVRLVEPLLTDQSGPEIYVLAISTSQARSVFIRQPTPADVSTGSNPWLGQITHLAS